MATFLALATWLDWKYNVLTLVQDDEWDNLLGGLFMMYGADDLRPDEREAILTKAKAEHGERPEALMMPDLQPLAEQRGFKIMIIENQSDGLGMFLLPKDKPDDWHSVQLGHVLILDAARGQVNDPRNGGKLTNLVD